MIEKILEPGHKNTQTAFCKGYRCNQCARCGWEKYEIYYFYLSVFKTQKTKDVTNDTNAPLELVLNFLSFSTSIAKFTRRGKLSCPFVPFRHLRTQIERLFYNAQTQSQRAFQTYDGRLLILITDIHPTYAKIEHFCANTAQWHCVGLLWSSVTGSNPL